MRRSTTLAGLGAAALTLGALAIPASAQQPTATAPFSGFATGTLVHADALTAGSSGPRLANVNLAEATASVGNPDTAKQIVNETGDVVQPKLPGSTDKLKGVHSFGGADALDVTLGSNVPVDQGQQLALPGPTAVSAGPAGPGGATLDSAADTTSLAEIPGDPLVYADLLRQNAVANWAGCILGKPYSYGESRTARVQLLDAGQVNKDNTMGSPVVDIGSPPAPTGNNGAAARTVSFTALDAVKDSSGKVVTGIASEVVEQVAPITLLTGQGSGTPIEIDVIGPWVLRTIAGGTPGSAGYYFGPLDPGIANNQEPAVIVKSGGKLQGSLTFQQLLGDAGIDVPGDPLIHVSIATLPHAIGDASKKPAIAADGTSASAALDLLKVQVLPASSQTSGAQGVDLRVGHMEASSTAPAGGMECQIPSTVTSNPPSGGPGTTFHKTYTVDVPSYFGCDVVILKEHDTATSPDGIPFTLSNPSAPGTVSGNTATWQWTTANAPKVKPGDSYSVTIDLTVPSTDTIAGKIIENAALDEATCALANATGSSGLGVPVGSGAQGGGGLGVPVFSNNGATLSSAPGVPTIAGGSFAVPTITAAKVLGEKLPRTGGSPLLPIGGVIAAAAAMGAWFMRRRAMN